MKMSSYEIIIILLLLAGIVGSIYPIAYGFIILPIIGIILSLFSIKKICYYLWIVLVLTVFFGAYISIPGYENYYLFRFLLPIHIVLFFVSNLNKLNSAFINKYKLYFILFILWTSSCVMSLFIADNISLGLRYLNYMFENFYLFFLSVYYIDGEKEYRKITKVILLVFHIAILIGIIEVTTGWHMRLSSANVYITTTIANQPTGFLYNPNDFALLLCILFPIVVAYINDYYVGILKWIWQVGIIFITIFLVVSTYSRIGMLCIFFSILTLIIYRYKKNSIYILGFLMPVVFIFCTYSSSGVGLFQKVYASFTDKGTSTTAREELYSTSWKIVNDSNFLGVGAGNAPLELSKYMQGYTQAGEIGYITGHNFWLESMGNLGVIGFIIIISIFILYFYQSVTLLSLNKIKGVVAIAPLLIGITFVGSSIALSTILEKRFLWLMLWLCICISRLKFIPAKPVNK
ncbi:hypothetical protein CON22_26100 [Bacillus cereus]|nr:hypothetical protein CON22_26100 [Bacillus cereus]